LDSPGKKIATSKVFSFKNFLMTTLIKWVIRNPELMESKIFLKAMAVFPEKISHSYDSKAKESGIDSLLVLQDGLKQISHTPKPILDLCTGTGLAAFMLADRFPLASIVGLDQSSSMVDIAKGKVQDTGKKRIRFETGNAADLSYGDAEFDLLVTSNVPVYLSEAAKVLKPGGLFLRRKSL